MPATKYQFELVLRRSENNELLAQDPVCDAYLQPLAEGALWQALRRGLVRPEDHYTTTCEIQPISGGPARSDGSLSVNQLRLLVGGKNGSGQHRLERDCSLGAFAFPLKETIRRLLQEKRLEADEKFEYSVLARPLQPAPPSPADRAVLRRAPLPLVPGRIGDLQRRCRPLNELPHQEDDTPVFIRRQALDASRAHSRRAGPHESGAFLVGRLFLQEKPDPEIFVVIEAAIEARFATQTEISLTLTTETYLDLERKLAFLREHLGRPEVMLLGMAHGHNMSPSQKEEKGETEEASENGETRDSCQDCPKRSHCKIDNAFYSEADRIVHLALFSKQPFGIGLVWGRNPRREDVLRVYGYRDGVFPERNIWIVD